MLRGVSLNGVVAPARVSLRISLRRCGRSAETKWRRSRRVRRRILLLRQLRLRNLGRGRIKWSRLFNDIVHGSFNLLEVFVSVWTYRLGVLLNRMMENKLNFRGRQRYFILCISVCRKNTPIYQSAFVVPIYQSQHLTSKITAGRTFGSQSSKCGVCSVGMRRVIDVHFDGEGIGDSRFTTSRSAGRRRCQRKRFPLSRAIFKPKNQWWKRGKT